MKLQNNEKKIFQSRDICSSEKLFLASKLLIKREQQKILHIFLEKISQIICQNF